MSKRNATLLFLAFSTFLCINKSNGQACLTCFGGSSDGYAKDVVSSCSPPVTIFTGGIYAGSSHNSVGTCSTAVTAFAAGGSFSGASGATLGSCAVAASIVAGGANDGAASAVLSSCNPPASLLMGGAYDGFGSDAVSPCAPPATLLVGGSFDGYSGVIVSVCEPPASLVLGGAYDGAAAAFAYCEPLVVSDPGSMEPFTVHLYPNPASVDFSVYFSAPLPKAGRISIHDVLGKEIAVQDIYPSKQQYSFKAKDWAEGAYAIQVVSGGKQFNKQLMIIRD